MITAMSPGSRARAKLTVSPTLFQVNPRKTGPKTHLHKKTRLAYAIASTQDGGTVIAKLADGTPIKSPGNHVDCPNGIPWNGRAREEITGRIRATRPT